jgi:osmotically-inducible protein OsmY
MAAIERSDSEIKREVERELAWETRVDETEVGVEVDDGVVTLTGVVSSWGKRVAAEEAAHRAAGVLDVANDIEVKPPGSPGRTDTEIAHAVRRALEWDVFVPDTRIQSTVSDGVVTLEGSVDAVSEREDAERAIRNLAGVRRVANKITIVPSERLPGDVRRAIVQALELRAHRKAERVHSVVEDGRVTLTGHVRSHAEREAVVGAVRYAPGVRAVDDRLEIGPYE